MPNIQKRGESSWLLTVMAGKNAGGKYIRRTKTVHCRTKREAESEYAKFRQEVESGEYIKPEKMTFSAFVKEWREKYAIKHLAYRTLYTYEQNLKNRILPAFGHLHLEDIKPLHIVDYMRSLEKNGGRSDSKDGGLSTATIEIDHRIIKNILSRAVEWKIIKSNPVANVKKPKVQHKVNLPYDEQEVERLLLALQEEPYHWRIMVTLALTTGLRRGELLGLEWRHIDWEMGVISVEQTLTLALKGHIIIKEPKTKNSVRKVALPTSVLDELRDYHFYHIKEKEDIKDAWKGCVDADGNERDLIFCHPDGTPFHHERPYSWFRKFIQKHNLRYIRFHDLRHTSATLLINQGVHAKIISERLGHGSISTTMNIYGHALRSADQAAADKFETLLSSKLQLKN
ncbi:tyrosine-type recombinase/integrase [Paenibacillus larvae]